MEIVTIKPSGAAEWYDVRKEYTAFLCRYGGRRLAQDELERLQKMPYSHLLLPGTALMSVMVRGEEGHIPAAAAFASDYGRSSCLLAVHPLYRGRQIGTSLLLSLLAGLGKLECRIPTTNLPGLKLCFRAGMQAAALEERGSGKASLVMTGSSDEVLNLWVHYDNKQEGEPVCLNPF